MLRGHNKNPENKNTEAHDISLDEGIACNSCHSGQCWYHILEKYGKHACSAIMLFPEYKALRHSRPVKFNRKWLQSDEWHQKHNGGHHQHVDKYPDFSLHWETWLPQLVWNLHPRVPLNSKVSLGWYDRVGTLFFFQEVCSHNKSRVFSFYHSYRYPIEA
jgi:hypothetical protein